jgi:hypothetical protein
MTALVIMQGVMTKSPVQNLLSRWPDRQSLHVDARRADADLKMVAVHRWFSRGSVPAKYWHALLSGAESRGIALTADELARAHSPNSTHCPSSLAAPSSEAS